MITPLTTLVTAPSIDGSEHERHSPQDSSDMVKPRENIEMIQDGTHKYIKYKPETWHVLTDNHDGLSTSF